MRRFFPAAATGRLAADRGTASETRKMWADKERQRLAKNREIIKKYDSNLSGKLEADQLRKLLEDLNDGSEVSDDEVAYMMLINGEANDAIDITQLTIVLNKWTSYMQVSPEITPLLEKHDTNHSGRLEKDQLKNLLTDLNDGKEATDEEVDWVMEQADLLGNGVITKPEMKRAVALWYTHVEGEDAKKEFCTVS
eukprot:gnl/TRDRNA2_/TRDRNA2_166310_c0_seq1.p1 gnl/TRDRNA2_/TRDRNA2_166310_c0~~gnl/TRDRNA2_/TRDRNA2_166310_c0_seq1.p1  ORF type:complete len:195 (+),score=35.94 gnl/TRDRNA2_/TRDRNA2_166310_c0_seq1:71-655(+)